MGWAADAIENNAADFNIIPKGRKTLNQGSRRRPLPARINDQNNRPVQPGCRIRRAAGIFFITGRRTIK